jgi:four helix bundle protein
MNQTMREEPEDLRVRTKRFALQIIHGATKLRQPEELRVLARQFIRSGTSVGAHYREACRARSDAEFVSKLDVALQELDETIYWLELVIESNLSPFPRGPALIQEADELIRIIVTMSKRAKDRR